VSPKNKKKKGSLLRVFTALIQKSPGVNLIQMVEFMAMVAPPLLLIKLHFYDVSFV